jgi:hypothetical protein
MSPVGGKCESRETTPSRGVHLGDASDCSSMSCGTPGGFTPGETIPSAVHRPAALRPQPPPGGPTSDQLTGFGCQDSSVASWRRLPGDAPEAQLVKMVLHRYNGGGAMSLIDIRARWPGRSSSAAMVGQPHRESSGQVGCGWINEVSELAYPRVQGALSDSSDSTSAFRIAPRGLGKGDEM